jgi:hypothetical protein
MIRNQSCSALSSVEVQYIVNSGAIQTALINLNPALPVNEISSISLPQLSFPLGNNTLQFSIVKANDVSDENPDNGKATYNFLIDNQQDRIPLRENFDMLSWPVISPQDGISWQLQFTNYENSATVQAYNTGTVGTEAWLATPVLDFSSAAKASVFFDYSYAFNGIRYDRLKVMASTDCGTTYPTTLMDLSGPNLANVNNAQPWTPSASSQWKNNVYTNLNTFAGQQNIRLAFVFINSTGNNFYLDNIDFYVSDNPNPVELGEDVFSVYWDTPTSAAVTFNLEERSTIRIQVLDVIGRMYMDITAPDILNQTFPVNLGQANAGIYLMRIQVGNQFFVNKFYLP